MISKMGVPGVEREGKREEDCNVERANNEAVKDVKYVKHLVYSHNS